MAIKIGTFSLPRGVRRPAAEELDRSAIIGVVDIVDVVDRHRSPGSADHSDGCSEIRDRSQCRFHAPASSDSGSYPRIWNAGSFAS